MKIDELKIKVRKISPKENDIIVFSIDVGNLSPEKAAKHVEGIINQYRAEKVNDNETLWLCHKNGEPGSDVTAIPLCEDCLNTLKDAWKELLDEK